LPSSLSILGIILLVDLKDLNFNKLSFDEQLSLEGEINVNEASKVLQKMNNNKDYISLDQSLIINIYLYLKNICIN
jgi:hypothetical protein